MSTQLKMSAYAALATMAAAASLLSVFKDSNWVVPTMGAVLLVSATCALIRRSPLPSAIEAPAAAIVILIWLTILYAHAQAHFGFIPGRLAFRHLGHIARHGFTEIHKLPTPAPTHPGLVMITVVGVAAVALVVDLMTVTLRRAALAGLPLLALFTVCAATGHNGVGLPSFVIAAVGYLILLYADNREKVARWGSAMGTGNRARPASLWSADPALAPPPAALARQVGAVAITFGVILPFLIPGLHTGINKHGTGTGTGGGGSVQTFDPIVRIGAELSSSTAKPILSYRSTSPDPGYLRMTSLDLFNGSAFTSSTLEAPSSATASEQLPVTPPSGPIVTDTITMQSSAAFRWLPMQATALGVSVGNSWRYDAGSSTVFSATTTTSALRYTTRSVTASPTSTELATAGKPEEEVDADLTLPHISPAVRRLTQQVIRGAPTRYDRALAIQRYLTSSRFTYDTSIQPDNNPGALDNFLLHTRRGFCQQFATAMAVMSRLAGIPSRVAVGFTRGTKQSDGSWLVTTHDAHAWPELWFNNWGWLPFEPTPRADGQAVTPAYAKPGAGSHGHGGQSVSPTVSASPSVPAGLRPKPGVGSSGNTKGGSVPALRSKRSGGSGATGWIVFLVIVAVLALPALVRATTRARRRRWMSDPHRAAAAAWAELRDTAVDLRAPWDDGRTPRQIAARLLTRLGPGVDVKDSVERLARLEEKSRYAPRSPAADGDLRRDVQVLRAALSAHRPRWERTMAYVLPRSTVRSAVTAANEWGEQVDDRWRALRHRLGPRMLLHRLARYRQRPA